MMAARLVQGFSGGWAMVIARSVVVDLTSGARLVRSLNVVAGVGYVGVSHDVQLPGDELFFSGVHLHGGPAPVRRFLLDLVDRIWNRRIDPGKVFDLQLPLAEAAEGYRAMDERRAIKVLLTL